MIGEVGSGVVVDRSVVSATRWRGGGFELRLVTLASLIRKIAYGCPWVRLAGFLIVSGEMPSGGGKINASPRGTILL
jgi:hypothetical protein